MITVRGPAGFIIREVPGIIYDPIDDRARIQGTGLEVFEFVRIVHREPTRYQARD